MEIHHFDAKNIKIVSICMTNKQRRLPNVCPLMIASSHKPLCAFGIDKQDQFPSVREKVVFLFHLFARNSLTLSAKSEIRNADRRMPHFCSLL